MQTQKQQDPNDIIIDIIQQNRNLLELPNELILHILSFLTPKEAYQSVSRVNKFLYQVCKTEIDPKAPLHELNTRLSIFNRRRDELYDNINDAYTDKNSCKSISLSLAAALIFFAIAYFVIKSDRTKTVTPGQIGSFLGFALLGTACLTFSACLCKKNCKKDQKIRRYRREIDGIDDRSEALRQSRNALKPK